MTDACRRLTLPGRARLRFSRTAARLNGLMELSNSMPGLLFLLFVVNPLLVAGGLILVAAAPVAAVLTAVAFVPLQLAHLGWLAWRQVRRRCPYDDCCRGGMPIHVCPCGHRYRDLFPNEYGLFYHHCRHGREDVFLPTLDALGRKKLTRLCRHCKRPIELHSFGELSERDVAVVGAPGVGKSLFLRQATRELERRLAGPDNLVRVDSDEQARQLGTDWKKLDTGMVLAKTAGDVTGAFTLALRLRRPRKLRCLLRLFDLPGEDYLSMGRFGRKQFAGQLAGVVLLVDPFSLPGLADAARELGPRVNPTADTLKDVVSVLANGVAALGRPGEKCRVPLAVVIGKADALPAAALPYLADLLPAAGAAAADRSGRCRAALQQLGADGTVRALEQRFDRVRYFACSPLGRAPTAGNVSPFRPAGVADPLLWLLDLDPTSDPR